jgi:hypothetical protein
MTDYVIGITLLSIALVLSSFMGLYQEMTYVKYGSNWREGLFYTVSNQGEDLLNIHPDSGELLGCFVWYPFHNSY